MEALTTEIIAAGLLLGAAMCLCLYWLQMRREARLDKAAAKLALARRAAPELPHVTTQAKLEPLPDYARPIEEDADDADLERTELFSASLLSALQGTVDDLIEPDTTDSQVFA
jgi:hypothetical protein